MVYRECEECETDVEVESDIEDDIEESATEEVMEEEVEEEMDEETEVVVPEEEDTAPPEDSVVPDDQHLSHNQNVPPNEEPPKLFERGIFDLVTLRRPVENVSSPSPKRFLCDSCEEKAADTGNDEEYDFYNEWYPY